MSSYARLMERVRLIGALGEAAEILSWDQQVMMPPGGTPARAAQLAAISSAHHQAFVAPETARLLVEAEREALDDDARADLRELRFHLDREARVPVELVEETSRASARGYEAWVEAKKANTFSTFQPHLTDLLRLRKRYAQHVAPDAPPYEALFQDYEPWIKIADARRNLAQLRDGLRPLIARAKARGTSASTALAGHWPKAAQEALAREVCAMIGYDFQRGRLDTSPHPFSAGGAHDARITTRYDERAPLSGLLAAMHEAGHAMYMQGLPPERAGTPLGEARDLVVHESQSRLWENHIGRSRVFWERAVPLLRRHFPETSVDAEGAWRAANDVRPTLVRVEADELTYHMHVALRFEIEEALISDKLSVEEVPHKWNECMQRDLGLTPPDDARGCLQDMHWSTGSFGYFPTYSLGSMLSAQLMAAYAKQGDPNDWGQLLGWLRANVHAQGKRYKTDDLIARATGGPLTPDAFLAYAGAKYGEVWA